MPSSYGCLVAARSAITECAKHRGPTAGHIEGIAPDSCFALPSHHFDDGHFAREQCDQLAIADGMRIDPVGKDAQFTNERGCSDGDGDTVSARSDIDIVLRSCIGRSKLWLVDRPPIGRRHDEEIVLPCGNQGRVIDRPRLC